MNTAPESPHGLSFLSGDTLTRLLDFMSESPQPWRDEDLASILATQLDMPLAPSEPQSCSANYSQNAQKRLRDILNNQIAPIYQLIDCKNFYRHLQTRKTAMPPMVEQVIYLGIIAAALLHHNRLITRIDKQKLKGRFAWVLAQTWVDPSLARIVRGANTAISDWIKPH